MGLPVQAVRPGLLACPPAHPPVCCHDACIPPLLLLPCPAAKSGPLVDSGFQAHLTALLVRLGTEHPHHTLYQVFALKNGNRGKDGKVAAGGGRSAEALSYAGAGGGWGVWTPLTFLASIRRPLLSILWARPPASLPASLHSCLPAVDLDKVAAAQAVLDRVAAASPASRAIVGEMSDLIDAYIELAATPPPSKEAEAMAFPAALRRSRQ